jgi:hypothetical protein
MANIKIVPEIAEAHASKLKSLSLKTNSPNAEISYTDIGDIQTGAEVNNSSYRYADAIQTDLRNYAQNILDLSSKIVAEDKASAQDFSK